MNKLLPLETTFFTSQTCYHIRLTDPMLELSDTYTMFCDYKYLIVSQEHVDTNRHQHILIAHPWKTNLKETKEELREIISKGYPNIKGNKGLSIKVARNQKSLTSYVLKEGEYQSKGFTDSFIKAAIKLSYRTDTLKKEYKNLQDALSLDMITIYQYSSQMLELKATHDQPIYVNHHRAHIIGKAIKHGYLDSSTLTEEILKDYYLIKD